MLSSISPSLRQPDKSSGADTAFRFLYPTFPYPKSTEDSDRESVAKSKTDTFLKDQPSLKNQQGVQQNQTNSALASSSSVNSNTALAKRDAHFPLLAKGINLLGWFDEDMTEATPEKNFAYINDHDFNLMKSAGLTHIRLPLAPKVIFDANSPNKINEKNYAAIERGIQKALNHQLGVVADLHPDDAEFKKQMATNPDFVNDVAIFWKNLASRLSRLDSDRIFFEPLNEPMVQAYRNDAPKYWQSVQNKLVQAIRQGAPNNTILVSSYNWDGIDGPPQLGPIPDQNIVYTVHYYTPTQFTHQGSTWSGSGYSQLAWMPYPNRPMKPYKQISSIAPMLKPEAQKLASEYNKKPFNAISMEQDFAPLFQWAKQNNAKLYLGEFGVLSKQVDAVDRARWILHMRQMAERNGMGWAMWDYTHEFGLTKDTKTHEPRIADPMILSALGLQQPKPASV